MSLLLLFTQPAATPSDITGAGAITFGAMTGAATGTVLVSGASASTFGAMTGAGAGKVYIVGAGSITFGTMTGSATAGAVVPTDDYTGNMVYLPFRDKRLIVKFRDKRLRGN